MKNIDVVVSKFVDAAYAGHVDVLKKYLEHVDIDCVEEYKGKKIGYNAIYNAVLGQKPEAVKFLIENGATVDDELILYCFDDFIDEAQQMAYLLLKANNHISDEVIQEYLAIQEDPSEPIWDKNIQLWIMSNFPELVDDLVKRGAYFE